ncbi:MAG: histidine phosphatase family protein [Actinomycetota bacterium]
MELFLVRHGKAFDADATRWPDDTERPLSPEGEEEFRRAAKRLGQLNPAVEMVFCSPLLRARQTAAILEAQAEWPAASLSEALGGGRPEDVLASLAPFADTHSIGLVGHNPFLAWTVSLLIAGTVHADIKMGTGSVAHLSVHDLRAGAGTLVGLHQSSDLSANDRHF